MAKLISMKRTAGEEKAELSMRLAGDSEPYAYGLRIQLEDDELEKLALAELPEVGSTMMLTAQVQVVSVRAESGGERCVGLQITDMALGAAKDAD